MYTLLYILIKDILLLMLITTEKPEEPVKDEDTEEKPEGEEKTGEEADENEDGEANKDEPAEEDLNRETTEVRWDRTQYQRKLTDVEL